MRVLVTGGAGYIGSHTCVELLDFGHKVLVLDNLFNGTLKNLEYVAQIANIELDINEKNDSIFSFIKGDVSNRDLLIKIFSTYKIDAVIHFAGFKSVNDSIINPINYYVNNVIGCFVLIEIMKEFKCKTFVFSSSASVYGSPKKVPINENFPLKPNNPYSKSKLIIENFLRDVFISDDEWCISILRYFNPVGAHKSGLIGDNPKNIPNNLMPAIAQVAIRKYKELIIFGGDYDTYDGTGVRDYIHVVDLAKSHLKALSSIKNSPQIAIFNIGTGIGYSVFDLLKTFEKVSNKTIPFVIQGRRKGDVASCYADPSFASDKIGWRAEKNLEMMCADSWNFEQKNNANYS
jgi:UDP-glucose 4-epimerase